MSQQQRHLAQKFQYNLPRIRLCLVNESQRYWQTHVLLNTEDAIAFLTPLRFESDEHFVSLHLNARHEVIGLHEVSHGDLASAHVHPREVFKAALLSNTFAIVVCHNHPSGSKIEASPEDLKTTKQLVESGNLLGIPVLDHLIVSPVQEAFSMRYHHSDLWQIKDDSPKISKAAVD